MAFIIPNATNVSSSNRYKVLDQAEPDSIDFEVLGNISRSGVISGCVVTVPNSTTITVASGVVVINGDVYSVSGTSFSNQGDNAPTYKRFDLILARLSGSSVSFVLLEGNVDSNTNPEFPLSESSLPSSVSYNGNLNYSPSTDVVIAAVYRATGDTLDGSNIVDKRVMLHSGVYLQGTSVPSATEPVGSLYYKTDVASNAPGSGLYVRNGSSTWIEVAQKGSNNINNDQLRQSAALSVMGRSSNSTGNVGDISASVDGHVLRRSGSSIGFGEVGSTGIADDAVLLAKLADEVANRLVPAGTISATIRNTADTGWLLMGQTISNADTLYPALWAVAPAAWKNTSTGALSLPSMANKYLSGKDSVETLGAEGGSNTKSLSQTNLPKHAHTIHHGHGNTFALSQTDHTHDVDPDSKTTGDPSVDVVHRKGDGYITSTGPGTSFRIPDMHYDAVTLGMQVYASTFDHTHTFDLPAKTSTGANANVSLSGAVSDNNSSSSGDGGVALAGTAFNVESLHMIVNFQIKAH